MARLSFDSWLFVLMLALVALAVGTQLYVSYTSLRYVFEVIGGMPPAVSLAAPFGIDASVAAGLLGEWWLAGRRQKHRSEFAYMVTFGLAFALITIAGNALHGALALTVQRPIELLIGGQRVAMPWWISIAVSAIPGLAIAAPGYAMALVVRIWRQERMEAGGEPVVAPPAPLSANEPASPPANVPASEPAHDLANEGANLGANEAANQPAQPEAPEVRTADEPSSQADSQPATAPAARQPAKPSARVMRIAREGGDWHKVQSATGLSEHGAKRALTSARKLIAADSQAGAHGDSQDGAQPGANVEVVAGANEEFAA